MDVGEIPSHANFIAESDDNFPDDDIDVTRAKETDGQATLPLLRCRTESDLEDI